jgi:dihydrodipicolinate synthase/N-acetylneuraminate lyase
MDAARFHGIYPILYAFFDRDGRPQRAPLVAQVEAAVKHRAHGVAVLGLATETNKLDVRERIEIMEWTAEALDKRLPLAVTVAEPSIHGQIEFVRAAKNVIAQLIEDTAGAFRVFNGRGGLELPDNLRAGCVGMIPAPECFDVQVQIFEAIRAGRDDEAERLYREILPLITFMMSSLDTFVCYGKRITARRLGIADVHDRAPCQHPGAFGLAMTERFLSLLPAF